MRHHRLVWSPLQGCSPLTLYPPLSRKNYRVSCVGTALGGVGPGGPPLPGLKVSLEYPLYYESLPAQVPYQQRIPDNLLTKLIWDCCHMGAVDSGLVPPLTRVRHSFSLRSLRDGQFLEYNQGWMGRHKEQALCSPSTPSSASPFIFVRCRCCCRFRSEGRSLGWY